jgi:hypothetical protein
LLWPDDRHQKKTSCLLSFSGREAEVDILICPAKISGTGNLGPTPEMYARPIESES